MIERGMMHNDTNLSQDQVYHCKLNIQDVIYTIIRLNKYFERTLKVRLLMEREFKEMLNIYSNKETVRNYRNQLAMKL